MRRYKQFWSAFITHSPALNTPLSGNEFPKILAANAPNNTEKSPPFCSFLSVFIVLLIPLINNSVLLNYIYISYFIVC